MADKKDLPAHIQAQLASAGRETDTGGQPWKGRDLGEGASHTHQYPTDDGTTPAELANALERFSRGEAPEEFVVDAMAGIRLFAPILAELSQSHITESGLVSDKESDMALVSIQAPDGRKALPVFSNVDALTSWHEEARPVAADSRKIALSAVEDENQMLVLNPRTDLTFVVRRPAMWAIAKGKRWRPAYSDPAVLEALQECGVPEPNIAAVNMAPGRGVGCRDAAGHILPGGGPGPELSIELSIRPGLDQQELDEVVQGFQNRFSAHEILAERVDSADIRLRAASA
ncbi:SseB family protein [Rothia uropygialis]|uniref:SseB family protein n=1 Tax=Kocuria sp. 36 TaxID=1415402 RepID=UPI00101D9097|nr:SseB family protein [Kocuria sp. 36]